MKLLAIRGENLASLVGRFEVDLTATPLDRAAAFAITGPKGAGKSTLLDACCLALFGRTPRLEATRSRRAKTNEVDEDVSSTDPRLILSAGEGAGWAEVDFVGKDKVRYRARWSVHRANKNPEARLRDVEVTFHEIDTHQNLGQATRTLTLALIEARLGLTYEQFVRAVLLAQGRFDEFLRAPPGERAALLEQIVGGKLYTDLSKAAHAKASSFLEEVKVLETQLGNHAVLDGAARATLEAALSSAQVGVLRAEADVTAMGAAIAWHAALADLRAQEDHASASLLDAEAAVAALSGEAERLTLVERVQSVRHAVEAFDAANRSVELANRELEEARAAQTTAATADDAARAGAAASESELRAARQDQNEQRPEVERARALDAALDLARREAAEATRGATSAEADGHEAQRQAEVLERAHAEAARARDDLAAWLAAHADDEPLARAWPQTSAALDAFALARADHALACAKAERLGVVREQAVGGRDEAVAKAELASRHETKAAKHAAEAEEASQAFDRTGLDAERSALAERRSSLDALRADHLAAAAFDAAIDAASAGAAEARRLAAEGERASVEGEHARRQAAAERATVEAELRGAHAVLSLSARRSELVQGESCPLCGATEHPWAATAPDADALVSKLEARARALSAEESTQAAHAAAARKESEARQREACTHDSHGALAVAERSKVAARWLRNRAAVPAGDRLPEDPSATGAAEQIDAVSAEAVASIEANRAQLAAAAAAQAAERAARAAHRTTTEEVRKAEAALRLAEQGLHGADQALSESRAVARDAETRASAAREVLEPLLVGRPDAARELEIDPRGVRRRWAERVQAWERNAAELVVATSTVVARSGAAAGAKARAEERAAIAVQRNDDAKVRRDRLEVAVTERAGVLGGRPADEVERGLTARTAQAEHVHEEALRKREDATRARAAADQRARGATTAQDAARGHAAESLKHLEASLRPLGLELPEVRGLLVHDHAWLQAQRARLADVRDGAATARAVFDERRSRRTAHESTNPPALDRDAAVRSREDALAARALARTEADEARVAIRKDDDAAKSSAALGSKLEALRLEAAPWLELNSAIGAADGKKLALLAQRLSLEALVEAANQHLGRFLPRYRLQAAPGTELDLRVLDDDLAGELRYVTNLSGGERFLVSLALAFGLASLSGRGAKVETLLIDEGLSTLDADTLDRLLAAFETLQTGVRQVGFVSHVPGLAARVGAEVRVVPRSPGKSRVEVVGAAARPDATPAPAPVKTRRRRVKVVAPDMKPPPEADYLPA